MLFHLFHLLHTHVKQNSNGSLSVRKLTRSSLRSITLSSASGKEGCKLHDKALNNPLSAEGEERVDQRSVVGVSPRVRGRSGYRPCG